VTFFPLSLSRVLDAPWLARALAQTGPVVRYEKAPPGSYQRGVWWLKDRELTIALVVGAVLVVGLVALSLYQRLRKR
jgi:hypothetical protein